MLRPFHTLVIWSAPPAMRDLQLALAIVNPARVVLFGVLPGTDSVQGFLARFSGAVKHVLASKQGKTTVPALCGVMAHSPTTIRAALDWMVTRGHITLQSEDGEAIVIAADGEQNRGAFASTTARLAQQIQEAAAFRAHFQRADASTLIQPI